MLRQNILFVKRFCANVCLTKSLICSVCRPAVGPLDWLFLTETWGQWGAPSAADGLWRVALRACCLVSVLWRAAAGGLSSCCRREDAMKSACCQCVTSFRQGLGTLLRQPWSTATEQLERFSGAAVALLRGCWRKFTATSVNFLRALGSCPETRFEEWPGLVFMNSKHARALLPDLNGQVARQ